MLVLTRKVNQSIMIGEIEVIVSEIRGDSIRLGIAAPKETAVHRSEVYEEIQQHGQREAAPEPGHANRLPSTAGMTLEEIRRAKRLR